MLLFSLVQLWECKLIQSLWRAVWRFLKKKKNENYSLPYDQVVPLLAVNLEKTTIRKDICTPVFIAVLLMIAKQPRCPSAEVWIKRMCYIYMMEYYSAVFLFLNNTS